MYVYVTKNKVNGKKYIGKTNGNKKNYFGSGKIIKEAIAKYGKKNFEMEILEKCEDEDQLREREVHWISYFNAVESNEYYNLDNGGQSGRIGTYDSEWSKKSSENVQKVWDNRTEEERKLIAKKVSESRIKAGSAKGKNNPMYGRSVVKEKNLKWYTNGTDNLYVSEGTQPVGYRRGRIMKNRR